jgi:hypothetical protein
MMPGFFKYCAAPLSELGFLLFDSGLNRSELTIAISIHLREYINHIVRSIDFDRYQKGTYDPNA